jgi:hypothetical protein
MPPADAAPDPLDRPAAALAAELAAWCAERSPPDAGAWLPALPFSEWFDWQRDLARRLAAAVLAAECERPAAGGRTMTVEDLSEIVIRHLQDARCVITPGAADDLTPVLAAAFREAEAVAAARRQALDAAACGRVAEEFGQRFVGSRDNRDAWAAVGAEACYHRIAGGPIGGPDAGGGGAGNA